MGYRNYFYSLPKEEYLKIKDMTIQELSKEFSGEEDEDYFNWHDLEKKGLKELYEFGKDCDFKTKGNTQRFFSEFEDEDCEFLLAKKEMFIHCIENYRQKVSNYYRGLMDKTEKEMKQHFAAKQRDWGGGVMSGMVPYNIDEEEECLVNSWEYEYVIFELVRIFKTFDFEKNVLIYAGY